MLASSLAGLRLSTGWAVERWKPKRNSKQQVRNKVVPFLSMSLGSLEQAL